MQLLAQVKPTGTDAIVLYQKGATPAGVLILRVVVAKRVPGDVSFSLFHALDGVTFDSGTTIGSEQLLSDVDPSRRLDEPILMVSATEALGVQTDTPDGVTISLYGLEGVVGQSVQPLVGHGWSSSAALSGSGIPGVGSSLKTVGFPDSPYSVAPTDGMLLVDASGGPVVLNLPALGDVGTLKAFSIKKMDTSLNRVSISADGAETIDDRPTEYVNIYLDAVTVQSVETGWIVTHRLHVGRKWFLSIDDTDSPYTVEDLLGQLVLLVDATAGDVTVNLPPLADVWLGSVLMVKRTDAAGSVVTVDADGAELIDGATTLAVSSPTGWVTLVAETNRWRVIG